MSIRRISITIGLGLVVVAASLAASNAVSADTASTPIGTITAQQYQGDYCDDFGAHVQVAVVGGLANDTYTALATGFMQEPVEFAISPSGSATIDLHNVRVANGRGAVGTATVVVSGGDHTVSVPVSINCPANNGG